MARVFVSTLLDRPIDDVWRRIRDFNALPEWVPAVASSRIEDGLSSDAVGCVRNFRLQDGGALREQLLSLNDHDHECVYSILESPMPVTGYVARLRLRPVTDGNRTYAEWTAEFGCPPEEEQALVDNIGQNVFLAAFHQLASQLA